MPGVFSFLKKHILFLTFAGSLANGEDTPTLKITCPNDGSTMAATKEFIRASYKNIGFQVIFKERPADKALTYLENKIFDADLVRSKIVEKTDKILRVDVPLAQLKVFMVTLKNREVPRNLKSIKMENRAAVLYGYPVAEKLLSGLTTAITRVSITSELESLITSGRVDFALSAEKLHDPSDKLLQRVVHLEDVYHVVSSKRKNLIPALEVEFRRQLSGDIKQKIQLEVSP